LIAVDELRLAEELAPWLGLQDDDVILTIGPRTCPACLVTCRPEDRCAGTVHWIHFHLDLAMRNLLSDSRVPIQIDIRLTSYTHTSPLLSEDVRQSLLDDIILSDRDQAA
jgi:hypothetical protein